MMPHSRTASRLAMREIIEALQRPGGVVLYPTETVWGIGGRARDSAAAIRVASLKGRPRLPLIVLVHQAPQGLPACAAALAEALWPGPVTLVVPGHLVPGLAPEVLGKEGTVGLRQSPHPVASALVAAVGPITSTSANLHGQPPVSEASEFAALVDGVAPGQPGGRSPSSVVDGVTGELLRAGAADLDVARILAGLHREG